MSEHVVLFGSPSASAIEPVATRLREMGFTVSVTSSAAEVPQLAADNRALAVLVDISAPESEGISVCSRLKTAEQTMPVIALNNHERALHHAARAAGADVVLDYPINWSDLRLWMYAPRSANGDLVSLGALLGRDEDDILGVTSLLAHDLKSPISIVITTLQMLVSIAEEPDSGISEINLRLLRGALSAAQRQMNLISDLVDLAKLELQSYDLQKTMLDLAPVVAECLETEAETLEAKGLQLSINMADEPLWVEADLELMMRVVSALVDNTLKFTIRDDRLVIDVQRENQQVILRFTDSGRTLDPGFEQEIMRRASQWEKRQAGARTSVAMGLPFIHAVAQAHGGDFTARTDPATGLTAFTFALPYHADGSEKAAGRRTSRSVIFKRNPGQ